MAHTSEAIINGEFVSAARTFPVFDPTSGDVLAQVADADATMTALAIEAASRAFSDWRVVPATERVQALIRWADLIDHNAEGLSSLLTRENGKVIAESAGEMASCAATLRWYAERALCIDNEEPESADPSLRLMIIRQPVGVVACITPWNFPAAAVIVKAGAAIAAGCATIVKPSEETPLIALALAALAGDAGIPPGVINVLPCAHPAAVGDTLCASPSVHMLTFTGSTRTARNLIRASADTIKRLHLELGGNAPFIVFDDASLDRALDDAVGARFYNAGQICVGANRFLVQDSIYDDFIQGLAARVSALTVGDPFAEQTRVGPLIHERAVEHQEALVEDAIALGARIVVGGKRAVGVMGFEPTLLANMTPGMRAYTEEVFGPTACVYRFTDEAQVTMLANETEAGLAAYVYTDDPAKLSRMIDALEAGVVGANSASLFHDNLPFGGIKQSGLGREHGLDCLDEFLELKSVSQGR